VERGPLRLCEVVVEDWFEYWIWFSMLVLDLRFVCLNEGLSLIIMFPCYLNATLSII